METTKELKPKTDKNNYITIIKCKESWSREEVVKLLENLYFSEDPNSIEEWIENNL